MTTLHFHRWKGMPSYFGCKENQYLNLCSEGLERLLKHEPSDSIEISLSPTRKRGFKKLQLDHSWSTISIGSAKGIEITEDCWEFLKRWLNKNNVADAWIRILEE